MSDVCIFCGYEGDDFDPEHWMPRWLSRALIPKHGSMVGRIVDDQTIRKRRYFDFTLDHVCRTCNGGWMSDIETRARDDVLRMVLAAPEPPLSEKTQFNLANWCFLKAITIELDRPSDQRPTYPREMYAAFQQEKKPPSASCSIALGFRTIDIVSEPDPLFVWSKSQGRYFPGPGGIGSETGYNTTLLIGHLVIDVAGLIRPVNAKVDHGEGFVPIWPSLPGKAFSWPPSKRFSGIADNDLV